MKGSCFFVVVSLLISAVCEGKSFARGVKELERIVGGSIASVERFSFTAFLIIRKDVFDEEKNKVVNVGFACGGSLISPSAILSAAHCVDESGGDNVTSIEIFMDCQDFTKRANDCTLLRHKEFHIFPGYNPKTLDGDYSVIIANGSFPNEPITLGTSSLIVPEGTPLTVVGHGTTQSNGELSAQLLETEVFVVDRSECDQQYGIVDAINREDPGNVQSGIISDKMLCAAAPGRDACQGDSGGPIFLKCDDSSDPDVQIGVVSSGFGCAYKDIPGIYSDSSIDAAIEFISGVVASLDQEIKTFSGSVAEFCGASLELDVQELEFFDPFAWTCDGSYFADGAYCDCDCGFLDPDCEFAYDDYLVGCGRGEVCNATSGLCVASSSAAFVAQIALVIVVAIGLIL